MFASSVALASTVHFKDGRTINGNIVEQDSSQVQVNLNGMTMTYYVDEIQDIDGKPLLPSVQPLDTKAPEITATQMPLISSGSKAVHIPNAGTKGNNQEKRDLILKFIDVFGTRKAMKNNFDAMIESLS